MIWMAIAAWFACGIVASGFSNAYEKARWPAIYDGRVDLGANLLWAIFGPFSLVVIFFDTGFGQHGWSLSPRKPIH